MGRRLAIVSFVLASAGCTFDTSGFVSTMGVGGATTSTATAGPVTSSSGATTASSTASNTSAVSSATTGSTTSVTTSTVSATASSSTGMAPPLPICKTGTGTVVDDLHATPLGGAWGTSGTVTATGVGGVLVTVQGNGKASALFLKMPSDVTTDCAVTVRVTLLGASAAFVLTDPAKDVVATTSMNGSWSFGGNLASNASFQNTVTLAFISRTGKLYGAVESGSTWTLLPGVLDIDTVPWVAMTNVALAAQGNSNTSVTYDDFNTTSVSLADVGLM